MIGVFAAFALGDLRVLRVIGLGMAAAVLLDATLVRMVATPAAFQLMGRANWAGGSVVSWTAGAPRPRSCRRGRG